LIDLIIFSWLLWVGFPFMLLDNASCLLGFNVDSKPSERKSSFDQEDMWVKIDQASLDHSGFLSKAEETD
jgi:hypothetical protein